MNTNTGIFSQWKRYPWRMLAALLFIFLSESLKHIFEVLKGELINLIGGATQGNLFHTALLFVLSMAGIPLLFYLYTRLFYTIQALCMRDLRQSVFEGILRHSYPAFLKHNEGHYSNAYINEINALETAYFSSIYGLLQIVAAVSTAMYFLYRIAPQIIPFSIAALIPALLLPKCTGKRVVADEKAAIAANEANIARLNEYLDGIETILNFGQAAHFLKKFGWSTHAYFQKRVRWFAAMSASFRSTEILLSLYNIVCILIVAQFVAKGSLHVGDYITALGIMNNISSQIPYTTYYLQQLKSARAKLDYIHSIADYAEPLREGGTAIKTVEEIRFDQVSFRYPDAQQPLFEDLSFDIKSKGVTLISGQSGSGKTTLSSLLLRYYPVEAGSIRINDIPLEDISNLNSLISIMRQESVFFDASLKENLSMFRDMPDERILSLMKVLGLDKYASKKALHAPVGSYSDGESKRMMLARALLCDKDITILDEPLANLDAESIQYVENALREAADKIILVISHQELNIPLAQQIHIG